MKYKLFPDPDESIPVLKELPDGAKEREQLFIGLREADLIGEVNGYYGYLQHYYYCPFCKGWIEGWINEKRVNNWSPDQLAGRMGTSYECIRCKREIAFSGVVS